MCDLNALLRGGPELSSGTLRVVDETKINKYYSVSNVQDLGFFLKNRLNLWINKQNININILIKIILVIIRLELSTYNLLLWNYIG